MGRHPFCGGPRRTRCAESTIRSTSLSRVGAERTRTHVVAIAYSHGPSSDTATLGGGAGLGGAGLGGTMAGSTGTRDGVIAAVAAVDLATVGGATVGVTGTVADGVEGSVADGIAGVEGDAAAIALSAAEADALSPNAGA